MFSSWKVYCSIIPQRWIFAIMGCLAITNAFTMRSCLSIAITEIVSSSNTSNNTSADDTCPASVSTSSSSNGGGTYEWDEYTQGIILSSFFWGYLLTQLPGGVLADKIGGKYTLGLGIFSMAIASLLTPVVVDVYGATGLVVLRFLMGLGGGTTFPAMNVLTAQWAPPQERSKICALTMSGIQVGTVLGTGLSGIMITYSSVGWPIVFYVFGGAGVVWFLAWTILCYSHPDAHPFISETEKLYLHKTMDEHTHRKPGPIPWRHILTSAPLWAHIVGKVGYSWGFYTLVTDLPKYMSSVLKFSIQANGYLSALPYLVNWLVNVASSWFADWLITNGKLSRTNVRKTLTTVGSVVPAIFIIAASYAGCDRVVVVILFTIGMGMIGPIYAGLIANPLDLSPNYSGVLVGIVNNVTVLSGIIAPYVVGVLTPNQTLSEWRTVFWITFVFYIVTTLIFDIWADGKVQYWNDPEFESHRRKELDSKNQPRKEVSIIELT